MHRTKIRSALHAFIGLLAVGVATASAQQKPPSAEASGGKPASAQASARKPNIVIIWGDDVGQSDISAYSMGLMGFRTPNIDRVAHEGVIFTDYYAEQSCTAGRSSFITGQSGLRTGNTKVGLPGAPLGLQARDVTIAQLLKGQGYATGQFGKNHLGDLDEHLPTNHGFDEFYGPLYHLNASEEPELRDYPKDPEFMKKFGPRGVIHSFAQPDGTQKIEDTGQLTKKRMETIDDDIAARSAAFIDAQHKAGKPIFVWVNFTHMHFRTHEKPESVGQAGRWQSEYHDVMIDHDKNVGTVLAKLDELGIADNTIVMYSTDNGPHMNSWPDAAMTPFRSEKNTNWEGAYRVPAMVRWPGHIKPGMVSNDMVAHLDWMPTLLAAAGVPDVKEQLLTGMKVGDKTFKVHLDGYNLLPYLTGQERRVRVRSSSISTTTATWSRCGTTTGNWCSPSSEPRARCGCGPSRSPACAFRRSSTFALTPTNARTSPRIPTTTGCSTTCFSLSRRRRYVGTFLESFKEFPPSQKSASFSVDQVLDKLREGAGSK